MFSGQNLWGNELKMMYPNGPKSNSRIIFKAFVHKENSDLSELQS